MDILDLIFPKACLECKREGKYLCDFCISQPPPVKQVCPVCLRPSIDGFTHPKCMTPQSINGIISLWPYSGVIRKAILSLKYKYVKEIAGELSELAVQKTRGLFLFQNEGRFITTIPLHWSRENIRGYNQVDDIAKFLAQNFSLPFYSDILIRKKITISQATLSKVERVKNIQGVFALNSFYKSLIASHKSLVLVDDVYTTGSTLKEGAKILKRNGAGEVWGLTIAK